MAKVGPLEKAVASTSMASSDGALPCFGVESTAYHAIVRS